MPIVRYPFEDPGPERLEISWETSRLGGWKNIIIRLDGQEIGTVPGKKELAMGQTFFLPGGSVLGVQLLGAPFVVGLRIVLDGRPLPGSAGAMDEIGRLTQTVDGAAWVLWLLGALHVVGGLLLVFAHSDFLGFLFQYSGFSPASIIFGLALLGLAFPIKRRSMWALVIVMVLIVIESIVGASLIAQHSVYRETDLLVLRMLDRILFWNCFPLSFLVRGVFALRKLKRWQPSTI